MTWTMSLEGPKHLRMLRRGGDSSESWSSSSTTGYLRSRESLMTGKSGVNERRESGLEIGIGGTIGSGDTTTEILEDTLHRDGTMTMIGTGLTPVDLMAGMIATETIAVIGLVIETMIALEALLQLQRVLPRHHHLLQLLQIPLVIPHLHRLRPLNLQHQI